MMLYAYESQKFKYNSMREEVEYIFINILMYIFK